MITHRLAKLKVIAILMCAGFSLAHAEDAESPIVNMVNSCRDKYEGLACFATTLRNRVQLRNEPKDDADVLQSVSIAFHLQLTEPFENAQHPGWLMTLALREGRAVKAWVRRSDVLFAWEFLRVAGCWPVSQLNWYEDPYGADYRETFRPRFDLSGNLISHKDDKGNLYKHYALYYASGIFFFWDPRDSSGLTPTFTLDYPKRRVTRFTFGGADKPSYRFVEEDKLKGCTEIPKVDPSRPIMPMPKRR